MTICYIDGVLVTPITPKRSKKMAVVMKGTDRGRMEFILPRRITREQIEALCATIRQRKDVRSVTPSVDRIIVQADFTALNGGDTNKLLGRLHDSIMKQVKHKTSVSV